MISLVIPMYNETKIEENLRTILKLMSKLKQNYEIIVVDDGSKDNSFSRAKKVKDKHLKVVGYKENHGKGYALMYGFKYTKGNLIVFSDADLELSLENLNQWIDSIDSTDILIGSKRHPESKVHYPLTRRILSKLYQMVNFLLFNLKVSDTQVGLKMFRREVLENILPKILIKRYAFDLEVLVNASKLGYRIKEMPIELKYTFESTVRIKDVLLILLDTLAIFYRLKILRYYDYPKP
jgi:glycosyltransferase involved in cell wall biosynthesis